MDVALVGSDARLLCGGIGVKAFPFSDITDAAGRVWDLMALTRDAAEAPFSGALTARSLLLPGDSAPSPALLSGALQVVGYGFSPRDTLTLSSVTGTGRLLCLQRSLLTLGGELLEPQELPLPAAFAALPAERALLAAGLQLLMRL